MIEERILSFVLALLTVLVIVLLAVWSIYGLWRTWRTRYAEPAMARAGSLLRRDLVAGRISPEAEAAARSLSHRLQAVLFARVGRQITGRQRHLIAELARTTGLCQRAEADCRSRRWARRLRGADVLALLGGGEAVVTPLLRDRHPVVRVKAAEWAVQHRSPAVVESLLDLLDDQDPAVRFACADSVIRMGPAVASAIAARLADPAQRGTVRLLQVAAAIRDTSFIVPALRLSRAEDPLVRAGAIMLLGRVGGEDAVGCARELLDDADPAVRRSAVGTLGSLGYWPAAPQVGRRLRDHSWMVRREAGLALRQMGAPGHLVLRRARTDTDRYAADMARMTLALPGTTRASP